MVKGLLAQRAWLAFVVVLLLGCCFHADGAFFRPGTHHDVLGSAGVVGILACGMTLVVLTGGIDLAVGSVVGCAGMFFALLLIQVGWSWPACVAIVVLLGAALGATSGALVAMLALPPFIATLAAMTAARGLAKFAPVVFGLPSGVKVQARGGAEEALLAWIDSDLPVPFCGQGVPLVGLALLLVAASLWALLRFSAFGRHVLAVGGNERAAHLAGISAARVKVVAYLLSGGLAALAGICQAARFRGGDPEAGAGHELKAIAAVVIGGTSLSGGRGGVAATLLGVLTVEYIEKVLSLNAVDLAERLMIQGLIVVLAVAVQRRR